MSEHIICNVVPAIIALVGTVFTGLVAYLMFRLKTHAEAATRNHNEKLEAIQTVSKATHKIVNSAALVQLQLNAIMARRIANMTRDSADEVAAALAEELYKMHKEQQG